MGMEVKLLVGALCLVLLVVISLQTNERADTHHVSHVNISCIMLFQRYLRQNLYANYQAAYGIDSTHELQESIISSALLSSFDKVDLEVQNVVHWSFQGTCESFVSESGWYVVKSLVVTICSSRFVGSTACAVVIHENTTTGKRSIISANLGDSRAILSSNGTAIDLTEVILPRYSSFLYLLQWSHFQIYIIYSRITNQTTN